MTDDERMELELLVQSQVGNADAFEELMRQHVKGIFRLCRRYARNDHEAEDLVQETFILCYRALRDLRAGTQFKPWLYRIAVNVCQTMLRKRYREDRKVAKLRSERSEAAVEPVEPEAAAADMKETVMKRVERLPDRQREVLLLHLNGGLSYHDIAQSLGITYEDVKTNLSLARKRLRQELAPFLKETV